MRAVDRDDNSPVAENEPRWRRLYAAVLGALALEVLLFWLFTRSFA
jgi:hypothetical protein